MQQRGIMLASVILIKLTFLVKIPILHNLSNPLHHQTNHFPLFLPLSGRNKGNFLITANYFIQKPCGSPFRLSGGMGINIHCGTYIRVSQKFLHIFRGCPV